MARFTHDLLVVGGGAAGLSVTAGAAQLGINVGVVEGNRLGGDCLYHGCVPSKTLLKSAAVYHDARNAERYGVPGGMASPPAIERITERVRDVVATVGQADSAERFRVLGAEAFFSHARFRSPHELQLDGGESVSAPKIVLATGSRARELPIPGLADAGYLTNRTLFELSVLPESLVVLGAGPLGVEMAQAFARLGVWVTLIDQAPHILPREDEDMAEVVAQQLASEGIEIITGAQIRAVDDGSKKRVQLEGEADSEARSVEAEQIVVAAGRVGNTEGLETQAAGVSVDSGFFSVDDKLRTARRHIMAVGDCNGRYLFTHAAGAEAAFAVRRLILGFSGKMDYRTIPWCTYSDPELASVGLNETRAREAGISPRIVEQSLADVDRAYAEGRTEGKLKLVLDRKDRVVGAQLVAPHAGEAIGPALYAVKERWAIKRFMSVVIPYPTLIEAYRHAAAKHLAPKLFNPRIRGLLRFFRRYRGPGPRASGGSPGASAAG